MIKTGHFGKLCFAVKYNLLWTSNPVLRKTKLLLNGECQPGGNEWVTTPAPYHFNEVTPTHFKFRCLEIKSSGTWFSISCNDLMKMVGCQISNSSEGHQGDVPLLGFNEILFLMYKHLWWKVQHMDSVGYIIVKMLYFLGIPCATLNNVFHRRCGFVIVCERVCAWSPRQAYAHIPLWPS